MQLEQYPDFAAFWDIAEPALLRREVENNMLLGQAKSLAQSQTEWLAAKAFNVLENGEWQACCLQKGDSVFVAGESQNADVLRVLADYYQQNNQAIRSIFGETFYVDSFLKDYKQKEKERVEMLAYRLEKLEDMPLPSGSFQAASPADIDLVVEWVQHFEAEIGDSRRRPLAQLKQENENRIAQGLVFKWVVEGEICSMAAIMRRSPNCCTVGLVYTPPALRGKGYAAACTHQLSQSIFDKGYKYCGLFTDKNNSISNHIYKKMGYECRAEFVHISF